MTAGHFDSLSAGQRGPSAGGLPGENQLSARARDGVGTADSVDESDGKLGSGSARHRPVRRRLRAGGLVTIAAILGFATADVLDRVNDQPEPTMIKHADLTAQGDWTGSTGSAQIDIQRNGSAELRVTLHATLALDGNREVWLATQDFSEVRAIGYLNRTDGTYQIPAGLDLDAFSVVDITAEPRLDPDPDQDDRSIVRGTLR